MTHSHYHTISKTLNKKQTKLSWKLLNDIVFEVMYFLSESIQNENVDKTLEIYKIMTHHHTIIVKHFHLYTMVQKGTHLHT